MSEFEGAHAGGSRLLQIERQFHPRVNGSYVNHKELIGYLLSKSSLNRAAIMESESAGSPAVFLPVREAGASAGDDRQVGD
jgi:hypothetical protein